MLRDIPNFAAHLLNRAFEAVRAGNVERTWQGYHQGLAAQDQALVSAYVEPVEELPAVAEAPAETVTTKVQAPERELALA